jgi:hypothetical protein
MPQIRNKTGKKFEEQVCIQKNLIYYSKRPTLKWSGVGKNYYEKIASVNFDVNKFYLINGSTFEKYDAIDSNGNKIEIKKYKIEDLSKWKLYSEPFPSVKNKNYIDYIKDKFGNGSLECAKKVYNNFIKSLIEKNFDYIIQKITESNKGIQLIDAFIPNSDLEFRIFLQKGWMGFNRVEIQFRKKYGSVIKLHSPIIDIETNDYITESLNKLDTGDNGNLFVKAKKIAKESKIDREKRILRNKFNEVKDNLDNISQKELNKLLKSAIKLFNKANDPSFTI